MNIRYQPRPLLTLFFAATFIYVAMEAADMPFQAKIYPWVVGLIGLALLAWQLGREILFAPKVASRETGADIDFTEEEASREGRRRALEVFGWLYGFAAALWLIGFHAGIPVMVFLYLLRHGERMTILISLPAGAAAATWLLFGELLHLPFPPGLLIEWLGFD